MFVLAAVLFVSVPCQAGLLEVAGTTLHGIASSFAAKHGPVDEIPFTASAGAVQSGSLEEWIAERAGVRCPCDVRRTPLGSGTHGTTRLVFHGEGEADIVLKRYPLSAMLKWKASPIQHRPIRTETHAHEQVANEVAMVGALRSAGVGVVDVVAADPAGPWLAKRFVDGEPLTAVVGRAFRGDPAALSAVRRFAAALAVVHANGLVIGDMTADNVFIRDGEPIFIDVDQGARSAWTSWDVVYLVYDALRSAPAPADPAARERGWDAFLDAFLQAYRSAGGRLDPKELFSMRNLDPIVLETRPDELAAILERLRAAVGRLPR